MNQENRRDAGGFLGLWGHTYRGHRSIAFSTLMLANGTASSV
jgi:hypothetical protein